jgi:3-hydroxy-9,10-secoandrosta-1,3,5(10)-triene-9,17-dione monooxygenase reductase component
MVAGGVEPADGKSSMSEETIDDAAFRTVLAHFATGVVVVTGSTPEGPTGLTCQSFSSLSLDPPLVLISIARNSASWPRIRATGRFAVNVLSSAQADLSTAFAVSGGDKFAGVAWRPGLFGNPLLDGTLAQLECEIEAVHPGGDHEIVVGRVRGLTAVPQLESPSPLVFFRSAYRTLSPAEE